MIVGLRGKAGAGKDFTASQPGIKQIFTRFAFATRLKVLCKELFHLTEEEVNTEKKNFPIARMPKSRPLIGLPPGTSMVEPTGEYWTPRELMQMTGQFFRSVDPDYWVRPIYELDRSRNWIITDVRMKNEAKAIHELGGVVVEIQRPNLKLIPNHKDISEVELDGSPLISSFILNDSDGASIEQRLLSTLALSGY